MIVWLNGTHGSGKTTTSDFVQQLLPDARVLDAEKVSEVLMDIKPGLPATDNF
ncbi:AAA family ATPase [Cryobacterium sp. Y57]|uniref:AAA family ATPase n=1 Tax=Cryobacterium sp. Y57 TaxID=2048287 RepID=UPI001E5A46E5|nr:AAA family ATPase [Cryobacterium sp. Y57]